MTLSDKVVISEYMVSSKELVMYRHINENEKPGKGRYIGR